MIVKISAEEDEQCWKWAAERNDTHRGHTQQNNRVGKDDDVTTHYYGVVIEFVASRHLKATDWVPVRPGGRGNVAWDFHMPDGRSVSCKGSGLTWGRMIIPNTQEVSADVNLFGTVDRQTAVMVGYMTPSHYAEHRYWAKDLPRPAWVMDQKALLPLDDLEPRQESLDAFAPQTRVQDDDFLIEIIERLGGWIKSVRATDEDDTRVAWLERGRPRASRRPTASASNGRGVPVAVELDETIKLGRFSAYEKPKPKGSARPWQLVWSKTREPLGVGLFTAETFANAHKQRSR